MSVKQRKSVRRRKTKRADVVSRAVVRAVARRTKDIKVSVRRRTGKAKRAKALDRPFEPAVLRRAQRTAKQYRLILEPDEELGFVGHALELPNVFADGSTANECVRSVREALTAAVATMIEAGQRPPAPSAEGKRAMQINIRLTAHEKLQLEEMARQHGYRSVSDYLRATALAR